MAPDWAPPPEDIPGPLRRATEAYRMRWKRRRLWWRARRKAAELTPVTPVPRLAAGAILCLATVRNEALRLPHWLSHHRRLGVDRFLIVDNGSDDGTFDLLRAAPDVSLWHSAAGYRDARFGVDWLGALQHAHGAGHWSLTLDADEIFVYPHWPDRPLARLAAELERRGAEAMGALMVELYPKGRLSLARIGPGDDPLGVLPWFDAGPYRARRQRPARNLWLQGGVRDRVFFAETPRRAPTLNKLPFLRWRRGMAYLNSCHSLLPHRLNLAWDGPGDPRLSGALLHTKFLSDIVEKSREEATRRQHFGAPGAYAAYHAALLEDPDLWGPDAVRYAGWEQLAGLGLISACGWD